MIHAERAFASAKMQGMLKRHKEAMEREHNVNNTIVTLKDSQLAKKDGEINKLKARVTQVQTKHKAKHVRQADIINRKQDSIKEQTRIHEKNICEMNDLMAEVNRKENQPSLYS